MTPSSRMLPREMRYRVHLRFLIKRPKLILFLTVGFAALYNVFLQLSFSRAMGTPVELKNRIILGSVLMPALLLGALHLIGQLSRSFRNRSLSLKILGLIFAAAQALLAPLLLLTAHVSSAAAVIAVTAAGTACIGVYGVSSWMRRLKSSSSLGLNTLRRHLGFVLILPVFFFVFLCEINDQWDVYEADAPYFGQFANNILRYDFPSLQLLEGRFISSACSSCCFYSASSPTTNCSTAQKRPCDMCLCSASRRCSPIGMPFSSGP